MNVDAVMGTGWICDSLGSSSSVGFLKEKSTRMQTSQRHVQLETFKLEKFWVFKGRFCSRLGPHMSSTLLPALFQSGIALPGEVANPTHIYFVQVNVCFGQLHNQNGFIFPYTLTHEIHTHLPPPKKTPESSRTNGFKPLGLLSCDLLLSYNFHSPSTLATGGQST